MVTGKHGTAREKLLSLEAGAQLIPDGASLLLGGTTFNRKPMEFVRALVRAGVKDLRLYSFLGSMDVDLLVGADCAAATYCSYVGFELLGMAPGFRRRAEAGKIRVWEHSEGTFINGLRASAMGVPFLPAHASFGSELLEDLQLKMMDCPYTGQKVLACKAIHPDVAVLHALRADPYGNTQGPGIPDFLVDSDYMAARAAQRVIVTVEEVVSPEEIRRCPERTVLFHYEVEAVVHAPRGAYPCGYMPLYAPDWAHLQMYVRSAGSEMSFQDYLKKHVLHDRVAG